MIGTNVFIRQPNGFSYTGRVVDVRPSVIVLTDAAWVAQTGRFARFMAGEPDSNLEVEPFPDGLETQVPRAYSEVTTWPHPLFRVTK